MISIWRGFGIHVLINVLRDTQYFTAALRSRADEIYHPTVYGNVTLIE